MAKKAAPAPKVLWKDAPDEHDYPAAASYLALLAGQEMIDQVIAAFHEAPQSVFKAKDILRASGLRLLPLDNPHVKSDLRKIAKRTPLAPILLVRGDLTTLHHAQIADGYHRVCASYHTDENTDIPVRIVAIPGLPDLSKLSKLTD